MTQCEVILRHLRERGAITQIEATSEYGILRLAARIADLRKQGHDIKSELICGTNRHHERIRYSVYIL